MNSLIKPAALQPKLPEEESSGSAQEGRGHTGHSLAWGTGVPMEGHAHPEQSGSLFFRKGVVKAGDCGSERKGL